MKKDILQQLDAIKQAYEQLKKQLEAELPNGEISSGSRIIFQTQIVRPLSSLLDQGIANLYPITETKRKYYFPVADNDLELQDSLKRNRLNDLPVRFPKAYESIQAAQQNNVHLKLLKELAGNAHQELIAPKQEREKYIKLFDSILIHSRATANFDNCSVNGLPIEKLRIKDGEISGKVHPDIPISVVEQITLKVGKGEVNLIEFCNKVITDVENILNALDLD